MLKSRLSGQTFYRGSRAVMDPALKRPKLDAIVAMGFHAVPKGSKRLLCLAWAAGDGLSWSSLASSCSAHERRSADFLAEFVDRVCQVVAAGGRAACCSQRILDYISRELYRRKLVYLADRWNKLRTDIGAALVVDLDIELLGDAPDVQLRGCCGLLISQHCVRRLVAAPNCACGLPKCSRLAREGARTCSDCKVCRVCTSCNDGD